MSPIRNGVYAAEFRYSLGSTYPWEFRVLRNGEPVTGNTTHDGWLCSVASTAFGARRSAKKFMRQLRKADELNAGRHK